MNGFREGSDGAQIVIDSSICDREHNEHRLPVVAAYLHELFKIGDGFLRQLLIKIGDGSVEESIVIGLVGYQTLCEHFGGIFVLLLSQEELTRFKVFFTFQDLLLSHFIFVDLLSRELLRNLWLNQQVLVRHGDVAHVVDIREVGSTLTSLVRSNVRDEQVARVQVV